MESRKAHNLSVSSKVIRRLLLLVLACSPLLVEAETTKNAQELTQKQNPEQPSDPKQQIEPKQQTKQDQQAEKDTAPPQTSASSNAQSEQGENSMVYRNAVEFANWVDNFFGDKKGLESASYDYLRLINRLVIREGESPEFRPRVKAKVILPQMSNTTSLLFSNDRSSDNKDFAAQELEQNDTNEDNNKLSASINFQTKSSMKSKIDYRLGLDSSLDIFAFARHTKPWVDTETLDIENANYLFWEEENGFGVATEFELNKVLNEQNLFRWKYSLLRAEKSRGNEWKNRFTLVDHVADTTWITYDLSIKGKTEYDFDVEQYRIAVRYRNKTPINWLYYEIEPEIRFMRNERYLEREMVPGIAIRLEVQFENQ